MTPSDLGESIYARAVALEADHKPADILNGVAIAFGMAMGRYLRPEDTPRLLRQEADRIEAMNGASVETRQ